jgi:mRNA interferase HigB
MKLISNRALREFAAIHSSAETSLQNWRRLIERGTYQNFSELKDTFASVDKVGDRYVFNIAGNKFRLIAAISYATQQVFVKAVLTHSEYDQEKWK